MNLVTDRSAEDVLHWMELRAKGYAAMSDAERAEWDLGMKGAYNATDLNRVGVAVQTLAARFVEYGYRVEVSPKTDWKIGDIPNAAQMQRYLDDISALKAVLVLAADTPQPPNSMELLTWSRANDIEKILEIVEDALKRMAATMWYSNEIGCGEI